jgi:pimeloyl-ACP methyl ester carboxylesterase
MRRRRKILLGLLAVVGILAVLLVVNTVVTDNETEAAKADGGRIVDLPGGDLQIREDGRQAGPPVVLIHGWTASIKWWDRITPQLISSYRLVRVDLLGHGGSEKPKDGYGVAQQADRVAAALGRLGVRRALIAGHSLGGEVAIALVARHPELARGLVVIDSKPDQRFADPDLLATLSLKPVVGQAMKRIATDSAIKEGLKQGFAEGFDVPDEFVRDFKKVTYTAYDKSYDESGDYVDDGQLARDIKAVQVPRLVIFGKEDRLVEPPAEAADYYRQQFDVPVKLVEGAGHSPMVEQPVETARLLKAFDPARERSRDRPR